MTRNAIKALQATCKKDGHIINCQDDEFWYCMYCWTKIDIDE
jgi:hypothetical protein